MTETKMHPSTRWAQRRDRIYLTIEVEDTENPSIILKDQGIFFQAKGGKEQRMYELDVELYGEISVPESKQHISARHIELVLKRKEPGDYWPRLLKDKAKQHYLKIDFNKWVDEDDDEEAGEGGEDPRDLDQMLKDMGGINDAMPNMDDINQEESDDSDDDEMPDLEEDKSDDKTEDTKEAS